MNQQTQLSKTKEFWDAHPCDAQGSFQKVSEFRYLKDPWLLPLLKEIASKHPNIVEIGCGQGTDGLHLCQSLPATGSYTGVDYSSESIARAKIRAQEAASTLAVQPEFRTGNAEALDFADNSLECIYSLGVLHHSPDTVKTVSEVYRVLKPGGTAFICLYNTLSPKVFGAHILRGIQTAADKVIGRDRVIYEMLKDSRLANVYGTMVQECFGTPILRSYTSSGMRKLFSAFEVLDLKAQGSPLPFVNDNGKGFMTEEFGFLWVIEAKKPIR